MSEYLQFREMPNDDGRKTRVWAVLSKSRGGLLGIIKWYGAWRQYCFYPERQTIFNRGCLDDINGFMDTQMRLRKSGPPPSADEVLGILKETVPSKAEEE